MPKYTLYLDVWLLRLGCNFIFEYLLLWATATVTRTRTTPTRLVLAALLGTIHHLLYLLASLNLIPFYGTLRFLPVVIIVSLAMLLIAFQPIKYRQLFSVAGYFYGIGFIAAGAGIAASYLLGNLDNPRFPLGTAISIVTILIVAELGWGIVHKRVVTSVYKIPLLIRCANVEKQMVSLIDTGNNLKDPLTRQPVIIVERQALQGLLPRELDEIIAASTVDHHALSRLTEIQSWQTRLRLIPYNSIGRTNGILIGFRPDKIFIADQELDDEQLPIIAVHPHSLDPHGEYSALVPPTVVDHCFNSTHLPMEERGESHA